MHFHVVKDAWPALFPDLRFTFAIFNSSSHPLFNNLLLISPTSEGWQSESSLPALGIEPRPSRMRGGDRYHSATQTNFGTNGLFILWGAYSHTTHHWYKFLLCFLYTPKLARQVFYEVESGNVSAILLTEQNILLMNVWSSDVIGVVVFFLFCQWKRLTPPTINNLNICLWSSSSNRLVNSSSAKIVKLFWTAVQSLPATNRFRSRGAKMAVLFPV